MYDLPDDPTAADIIQWSIVCHSTLLAEVLEDAAMTHRQAAATMHMHSATKVAERLYDACKSMARAIRDGELDGDLIVIAGADHWITALNLASRLQCLPPHVRTQAAIRTQERIDARQS